MEELVKNILVPQYGAEDDIRNLALVKQHQIEQERAESEIDSSRQSLTPSQKRTPNRIPRRRRLRREGCVPWTSRFWRAARRGWERGGGAPTPRSLTRTRRKWGHGGDPTPLT